MVQHIAASTTLHRGTLVHEHTTGLHERDAMGELSLQGHEVRLVLLPAEGLVNVHCHAVDRGVRILQRRVVRVQRARVLDQLLRNDEEGGRERERERDVGRRKKKVKRGE